MYICPGCCDAHLDHQGQRSLTAHVWVDWTRDDKLIIDHVTISRVSIDLLL